MDNRTFIYINLEKLSEIDIRRIMDDFIIELGNFVVEKKTGTYIYIDKIPEEIIDKIKAKMDIVMKNTKPIHELN